MLFENIFAIVSSASSKGYLESDGGLILVSQGV